ncbi:unnamed protein product [Sphagnum balticum]
MDMSAFYGPPKAEEDMIRLIRHAVELGITFFDIADAYDPFNNEILLGKAIKGIKDKVQIATKFAFYQDENGNRSICGEPEYVPACCKASLKRLDVECIDLYYQHRLDPKVGEMKKLVEEGKVKYLGLSKASASEIQRAHVVHPITAVQIFTKWCFITSLMVLQLMAMIVERNAALLEKNTIIAEKMAAWAE